MSDRRRELETAIGLRLSRAARRPRFVWGAGEGGQRAAAALAARGVVLDGFVDRDPAKTGTRIAGLPVVAPNDVRDAQPRPRVVIASIYWREIAAQLRAAGFRRRVDFEVYPVDGADDVPGLYAVGTEAAEYAAWRDAWHDAQGFLRPGRGPRVTALPWPDASSGDRRQAAATMLRRLPRDDRWVVVYDARVTWRRWRWADAPGDEANGAPAVDHWAPPNRRQAFLMDALAHAASLAPPIVCRARLLRAFAATTPRWSLAGFAQWVATQPGVSARSNGVVEVRPRGTSWHGATGSAAAVAPGLVAFAAHRAATGRRVFAAAEAARVLPCCASPGAGSTAGLEDLGRGSRALRRTRHVQVLVHSRGNFFFREIRDFLAQGWRRLGVETHVGDERTPPCHGSRPVIVAPHEFFALGGAHPGWDRRTDLVLVNTEQPQTPWFAACLARLVASPLVFDLNWQTALLLRTFGAPAHFLPLGYDAGDVAARPRRRLPASRAFAGMAARERQLPPIAAWHDRPIDVLFVGTLSPRRARALAAAASTLARYRCFLHLPPTTRPLVAGGDDSLHARDMADLCRRAKIVLNVHRDDVPYFEWHRVVSQGIRQGALVVSEPMMPGPAFTPGVDFVESSLPALPQTIERLLASAAGGRRAARIAAHGHATLRRRFRADRIARRALDLL